MICLIMSVFICMLSCSSVYSQMIQYEFSGKIDNIQYTINVPHTKNELVLGARINGSFVKDTSIPEMDRANIYNVKFDFFVNQYNGHPYPDYYSVAEHRDSPDVFSNMGESFSNGDQYSFTYGHSDGYFVIEPDFSFIIDTWFTNGPMYYGNVDSFLYKPIPEPTTIVLVGIGLILLTGKIGRFRCDLG